MSETGLSYRRSGRENGNATNVIQFQRCRVTHRDIPRLMLPVVLESQSI